MKSRANEYSWEKGTATNFTAGESTAVAVPANPARRNLVIVNGGASDVYLAIGAGAATVGSGILLKSGGGAYEMNATNLCHGAVQAITGSGTSLLSIHEGV